MRWLQDWLRRVIELLAAYARDEEQTQRMGEWRARWMEQHHAK